MASRHLQRGGAISRKRNPKRDKPNPAKRDRGLASNFATNPVLVWGRAKKVPLRASQKKTEGTRRERTQGEKGERGAAPAEPKDKAKDQARSVTGWRCGHRSLAPRGGG